MAKVIDNRTCAPKAEPVVKPGDYVILDTKFAPSLYQAVCVDRGLMLVSPEDGLVWNGEVFPEGTSVSKVPTSSREILEVIPSDQVTITINGVKEAR